MFALLAEAGFERLEELIGGSQCLMRAEAVRRGDHAVAFKRRDDARRLTVTDLQAVLQHQRRGITEAGDDAQYLAVDLFVGRLLALRDLGKEVRRRIR